MYNKVILVGNLGKDPELKVTPSQMQIVNFSLATTERRKNSQSGQWENETTWHNIVVFGTTAENCSKYLKKGSGVVVEGKIQTRKWQDKEGKDRYTTEIVANSVTFLPKRDGTSTGRIEVDDMNTSRGKQVLQTLPSADELSADPVSFDDDDIPF